MEKTLQEIISEIEKKRAISKSIRKEINLTKKSTNIIKEDSDTAYSNVFASSGAHTTFYNIFVQPFVDVLKALKLVAMDFSNSIQLLYKAFTVFDEDDLLEALENFNEKRQEINRDWHPLLEKVDKIIGGMDPVYKLSLLGPAAFYAIEGLGAGLAAGKTVAEVLTAVRWEKLKDNFKTRLSPEENLTRNSRRIQMLQNKLIRRLNRIFFTQSVDQRESLNRKINESNDDENNEKLTPEAAVDLFLKITGLGTSLEELKISNSENLISSCKNILSQLTPLMYASQILEASNIDQLSNALKEIESMGAKINFSIGSISSEIKEKASQLAKNEKFKEDVKKQTKKEPSEDELKSLAINAIFNLSKESLNLQIISQIKRVLPIVDDAIKDLRIDSDMLGLMKKDSDETSKIAAEVYEELLNTYKNIKASLSKVIS